MKEYGDFFVQFLQLFCNAEIIPTPFQKAADLLSQACSSSNFPISIFSDLLPQNLCNL
jgi:hypothetical protein